MEKSKINMIIIFLFLVIICSLTYMTFGQNDIIMIEGAKFTMPDGYHESKSISGDVRANLTDGSHFVYISVYNDTNISKYVNAYPKQVSNNATVHISNLTVDNLKIYRSFNEKNGAIHYWFVKNGKVYSVFNWGGNNKMDSTFFSMIRNV